MDYNKVYAQYEDEITQLNDQLAVLRKKRLKHKKAHRQAEYKRTDDKIRKLRHRLESIENELKKAMGDPYTDVKYIGNPVRSGSKYTGYREAYKRPFQGGKFSPK